ncbi:MAG: transposase [Candidatus Magasanikbacteria bacterium RIFCSPLOWO2_01_FULL_43_20b]|uniref:Transposase n=1 Tax=Candidatus Magasanikbacteria bacterium RIFCSPLOWO2_12_FULL_43_12 TaxID=1798692 RepID=A0A1F6MV95_9BACT|nr:MAG: transposase [Candidatus Magasanikbacteria bacterium RIFCSPLOWO2_02_FULL_43_22]OGH72043.1 MAG: transposase [Candidatus Magasanikbacteria bacterium RIFCSPHIGHO2_02_FULL_44_13]OGH72999.1 MAG: transposase [Candidatus Magasanikbacteria bacterium RIFCSPLOWO2_01_FULL_43_20b]OGH75574.1 MAG: transposase [Candidatus Magasanikbacteria bacterium RIFCSPLOWO2_12_FULL_43_12]
MSNTYSNLLFHAIFSTKERVKLLSKELRNRLFPYISGIANKNNFKILTSGGAGDHVHILLSLKPDLSVSKAVQLLKGNSSKWIHDNFTDLNIFSWQNGYGVFTVSRSQADIVENYIANQEEHHKKMSFEEEYIELLKRN